MTTTPRSEGQGGPPPGWPAAAVPAVPPVAVGGPAATPVVVGAPRSTDVGATTAVGVAAAELAFPPVDPGFKRGAVVRFAPAPVPAAQPVAQPMTAGNQVLESVPNAGGVPPSAIAGGHGAGGSANGVATSPPLVVDRTTPVIAGPTAALGAPVIAPITPAAQPPLGEPAAARAEIPLATPPARAASPRSRLGLLAALGVVLVGGAALGSFLFLRSSSSQSDELPASSAKPMKSAKKGKRSTPAAAASGASEAVVEDTPPPTMQADSAAPAEAASAAPSTSSAPHSRLRVPPLKRLPPMKR